MTFSLSDSDLMLKKREKDEAAAKEAKEKEEADKKNAIKGLKKLLTNTDKKTTTN